MKLPDDCRFTYVVNHEAYYADSNRPERKSIGVHATSNGGGVAWEFAVVQYDNLGGHPALHLEMFYDSWDAFIQVPELFTALQVEKPSTLAELRGILDRLGAVDITARRSPYEDSHLAGEHRGERPRGEE